MPKTPHKKHHCKECKKAFYLALKNIDPDAQEQLSNPLPPDPKAYPTLIFGIHKFLIDHSREKGRGPKGNWLAKKIMPFDYFLPNIKVIVEFDERQHFTQARLEALKLYPKNTSLGFDKERWKALCIKLNRKDNDPPYRDEQRAWLDTIRDLGPHFMAKYFDDTDCPRTTIRIYEEDKVFCQNPISDSVNFINKAIKN